MFERFWHACTSLHAGAGLGLAIVAEIARAYGGTVEIDDQPGAGARMRLAFART